MIIGLLCIFPILLFYIFKIINIVYNKKYYSYKRIPEVKYKSLDLNNQKETYIKDRYSKKKIDNDIDVIIIGSGISGLTTGALLSKAGKKVLILEQHDIAGGCMHSFNIKNIEHETGLHYIGNIHKRKKLLKLITTDEIEWCEIGDGIYDDIYIENRNYKLCKSRDKLEKYLIDLFPHEKKGIIKYFDLIVKVSDCDLYFKLKSFPYKFISKYIKWLDPTYYKYCNENTYKVISNLVKDKELISVLLSQYGDYGIEPKKSNFYTHASIVNHYLDGGYFPKNGTNTIANSIIKLINNNGGRVLVGKKVDKVIIENEKCVGVCMENGDIIYSKCVVSSIGIRNTSNNLVNNLKFKKDYDNILNNVDSSVYHFYCFIKLDGSPEKLKLPSSNIWIYNDKKLSNNLIDGSMFIAFSCAKDSNWKIKYPDSSNCVILKPINRSLFKKWENTTIMKRGEEYEKLKKDLSNNLIENGLLKKFPHLKNKILDVNTASNLSTKYYINSYWGESYGLDMSSYRLLNGHNLRPKTNIENFYLTGQDICSIGITGGLISGILTANVIMSYDNILDILLGNNIVKDLLFKNGEKNKFITLKILLELCFSIVNVLLKINTTKFYTLTPKYKLYLKKFCNFKNPIEIKISRDRIDTVFLHNYKF